VSLVLVCDSPSPFREALERALEALGHRVWSAPDAAAMLALLRSPPQGPPVEGASGGGRFTPDCVVLEEGAVGGTSALFATALRIRGGAADRPAGIAGICTLAIIERQEPEARAAALQIVDDVVSRPAHLVEVVARIEALLRGRAGGVVTPAQERGIEDVTTGLRSRAFLDERIGEEWRRATRYTEPLALMLVGLEGSSAKQPQSDRALKEVGGALRRALRQIDVLGRFASTELAALLVNTHLAGALTCAERLRKEVGALSGPTIEVVMGLALFPGKDVTSGLELTRVAERALERARTEGPGSICLIQHQGYLFQQR